MLAYEFICWKEIQGYTGINKMKICFSLKSLYKQTRAGVVVLSVTQFFLSYSHTVSRDIPWSAFQLAQRGKGEGVDTSLHYDGKIQKLLSSLSLMYHCPKLSHIAINSYNTAGKCRHFSREAIFLANTWRCYFYKRKGEHHWGTTGSFCHITLRLSNW